MKVCLKRFSAFAVALFVLASSLTVPAYAGGISFNEGGILGVITSWIGGSAAFDYFAGTDHSGNYAAKLVRKSDAADVVFLSHRTPPIHPSLLRFLDSSILRNDPDQCHRCFSPCHGY